MRLPKAIMTTVDSDTPSRHAQIQITVKDGDGLTRPPAARMTASRRARRTMRLRWQTRLSRLYG
jgi:hypothetical protein